MKDDVDVIGTSGGVPVTDVLVERLAQEAERGYNPAKLKLRDCPRIALGLSEIVPVRLDPDLRRALEARAAAEQTSEGAVIRRALREYLDLAPP